MISLEFISSDDIVVWILSISQCLYKMNNYYAGIQHVYFDGLVHDFHDSNND